MAWSLIPKGFNLWWCTSNNVIDTHTLELDDTTRLRSQSDVVLLGIKIDDKLTFAKHVSATVYPKKYAHGFCCAVLCCGYTLIFPYPPGLLRWHCGNLTIAPVPAKQPWWIWINTSCEIIMNDYITTTKQSTTKPCAYFSGYTVFAPRHLNTWMLLLVSQNFSLTIQRNLSSIALLTVTFSTHPSYGIFVDMLTTTKLRKYGNDL